MLSDIIIVIAILEYTVRFYFNLSDDMLYEFYVFNCKLL